MNKVHYLLTVASNVHVIPMVRSRLISVWVLGEGTCMHATVPSDNLFPL